jgi:hypothetical protein
MWKAEIQLCSTDVSEVKKNDWLMRAHQLKYVHLLSLFLCVLHRIYAEKKEKKLIG